MIRRILLGLVGFAVLMCGCQPTPVAQAPTTSAPPRASACNVKPKVYVLDQVNGEHFRPREYGDCTALPCTGRGRIFRDPTYFEHPAPPNYKDDIQTAISYAPTAFQNEFCKSDFNRIYIDLDDTDPTKTKVWGMRETLYNNRQNIGISKDVIDLLLVHNSPVALVETCIFQWLLGDSSGGCPGPATSLSASAAAWVENVSFTTDQSDNVDLALLDLLAHEMGHIIWKWQAIDTVNCAALGNSTFYQYSWLNDATHLPVTPRYHEFGAQFAANMPKPAGASPPLDRNRVLSDLIQSTPNLQAASDDLYAIYTNGYWVDLFATIAPDEDFIETYKFWVLTKGSNPLNHLVISIPSEQSTDIIGNLASGTMPNKLTWITSCVK